MAIEAVTCPNCGEDQAARVEKIRKAEAEVTRLNRLYRRLIGWALAFAVLISLVSAILWIFAQAEGASVLGAFPLFLFAFIAAFAIFSGVLVAPVGITMGVILNTKKKKLKTLKTTPSLNPDA